MNDKASRIYGYMLVLAKQIQSCYLEKLKYHPDYLELLRRIHIPGLLCLRHFVFFSYNTFQKTFWSYHRIFKCTVADSATLFNVKGKKHVPSGEVVGLSAGNVD